MIMAVLLLFVLMGGCSSGGNDAANTESKSAGKNNPSEGLPLSGKHFVIGVNAEAAPYESIDEDGNFVGFDIDFADALSKKLGFTYEWKDMEFFGLIGAVQEKRVDMVISAISGTDERKKRVDFSKGYSDLIMTIISKPGSGIETVDDLPGKKVGAVIGSNFEALIKEIPDAKLVTYDVTVPAVGVIGTPELDALIEMSTFAEHYAAPKGLEAHVIPKAVVDELVGAKPLSIAFPKGSDLVPLFDQAIDELEEEGTMDKIREQWFGKKYVEEILPAYYGEN